MPRRGNPSRKLCPRGLDTFVGSGGTITREALTNIVFSRFASEADFRVAGTTSTLLYSGTIGGKIHSSEAAKAFVDQSGGKIAIVDHTPVGRALINGGLFEAKVLELYSQQNPHLSPVNAFRVVDDMLQGRTGRGLWDDVSERFVGAIQGPVKTITPEAALDRIFARTEVPALLRNPAVSSIDGISRATVLARFQSEVSSGLNFGLTRAQAEAAANQTVANALKWKSYDDFVAGHVRVGQLVIDNAGSNTLKTFVDFDSQYFGKSFISDVPKPIAPAGTSWRTAFQLLSPLDNFKISNLASGARTLNAMGVAGDVLQVGTAIYNAQQKYFAGDYTGAANELARGFGDLAGGAFGVAMAGLIGLTGPVGLVAALLLGYWGSRIGADLGGHFLTLGIADFLKDGVLSRLLSAAAEASPLVLDLDGDGVELVDSQSAAAVMWDGNQDGTLERSGWVGLDDGLLVHDSNGNGIVDGHSELFGSESEDGFAMLAMFDVNGDGWIDRSDPGFADLRIWRDADGDATTDDGELASLSDWQISALPVQATATNQTIAGNRLSHIAAYQLDNTTSRTIADAWFAYDTVVTEHRPGPDGYRPAALLLPNLRGYGAVPSLLVAMSGDDLLFEEASAITRKSTAELFDPSFDLAGRYQELLFRWAGVHEVDPGSRGRNIDARELALLEALTASDFSQRGDPNPAHMAAATLHDAYLITFNATLFRFLAQTAAAELIRDLGTYDYAADRFTGAPTIDFAKLGELIESWDLTGQPLRTAWGNLFRFFDGGIGLSNLSDSDRTALETLVAGSDPGGLNHITYASVFASVFPATRVRLFGTDDANTLTGGTGPDTLLGNGGDDTLFGRDGHDRLEGGDGADTLHGENGDDTLLGGDGDDTYVYASGLDTILDSGGTDTIAFPADLTLADITVLIAPYNETDAHILIGGSLAIVVEDMFTAAGAIEFLQFGSAAPIAVADLSVPIVGTETDDELSGRDSTSAPQDHLYGRGGDDRLTGGLGDDRLYGGDGNDTYVVTHGTDRIEDSSGAADRIVFGPSYARSDMTLLRDGFDLSIAFSGITAVVITDQFDTTGAIEQLVFDDGSSLDLTSYHHVTEGTGGRDTLYGIAFGGGGDVMRGLGGDDWIVAQAGDDELDGGPGRDMLNGGAGNDRYLRSEGADTVQDSSGLDTLVLGDIARDRVGLQPLGLDLVVSVDGIEVFRVEGQFSRFSQIEHIELGSFGGIDLLATVFPVTGTSASETIEGRDGGASPHDVLYGLGGDDRLEGGDGNDLLDGGDGDDDLRGGLGNDRYLPGAGRNLIRDYGAVADQQDALELPVGVLPDAVTLRRMSSGELVVAWPGGQATIIGAYDADTAIEHLVFADGESWNLLDRPVVTHGSNAPEKLTGNRGTLGPHDDHLIGLLGDDELEGFDGVDILDGGEGDDVLSGGTGGDRYILGPGQDFINDGGRADDAADSIELPVDIAPSDVTMWRDGDGRMVLSWPGGGVTIARGWEPASAIELLRFADGTEWRLPELPVTTIGTGGSELLRGNREALGGRDDTIRGLDGDDSLLGYDGADTLDGGAGNDTLEGSTGNDNYVVGQGWDLVVENGGDAADVLRIDVPGITLDTLRFERLPGGSARIAWNNGADGVTLDGGLSAGRAVEFLELPIGPRLVLAEQAFVDVTPPTNLSLSGDSDANTLTGGDGNDSLYGRGGPDVYVVGRGNDIITDVGLAADGPDEVRLPPGIAQSDLHLHRTGEGDLVIRWLGGSARITDAYDADRAVERLLLADGTAIDLVTLPVVTEGSNGPDVLYGNLEALGSHDDTMRGFDGDDWLYGYDGADTLDGGPGRDQLEGGAGGDLYVVEGYDTIYDRGDAGDAPDAIVLPAGITRADISLVRDDRLGNLIIAWPGGSATVVYAFSALYHVEQLVYGDGSIDIIAGLPFITRGTHGADTSLGGNTGIGSLNDTIEGLDGDDRISGGAGDDTLIGGAGDDWLFGGPGADTYVVGEGHDRITDSAAPGDGDDTIMLPAGVRPADLTAVRTGDGDLRLLWDGGSVQIDDAFLPNSTVELLHFGDGTVLPTMLLPFETHGSGEHEHLYGNTAPLGSHADTIRGKDGNDYLYGEDGDDRLDGGPGGDVMWGGTGDDTYVVDHLADAVYEYAGQGNDTVESHITFTLPRQEIENLILLTGDIDGTGNEINNRLVGNTGANTLSGGAGNDQIEGGGGRDRLIGGPDNDVIRVPDTEFVLIDGGTGSDTLELTGGDLILDITPPGDIRVLGIDRIDLAGTGDNQLLLSVAAILAMANGTNHLIVDGDIGDSVAFVDEGWQAGETTDGRATYSNAGVTLHVSTAVDRPSLPVTLSIASTEATKPEGTGGTTSFAFAVTRGGDTASASSVAWAVSGTGANPVNATDFQGSVLPSGTVTFAAGETSQVITIEVAADDSVEPDEVFTVTLSDPIDATLGTGSAVGEIQNDDELPLPELSIGASGASKPEGTGGTTSYSFTITRSGDTASTSSVTWSVSGSDANPVNAADFEGSVLPSGTVTFAAGETSRVITVEVVADDTVEPDEGFTVTLSDPVDATLGTSSAVGEIQNDDELLPPELSIGAFSASKLEGTGGATSFSFTVTRSGDTASPSSVAWAVSGSGANPANAADFEAGVLPSGSVTFAAGEISQVITIAVAADSAVEPDEGFTVALSDPVDATLGTTSATGVIQNDDVLPLPNLSIVASDASKPEGTSGTTSFTFTVTRSGAVAGPSSVAWAVAGSGANPANATDFEGGVLPSGSLDFAAEETSKPIILLVAGDTAPEFDESFIISLSGATGSTIDVASASGTIENDDLTTISLAATDAARFEGKSGATSAFTFTVSRSDTTLDAVSLNYSVAPGTMRPANAEDFAGGILPTGTVSFGAGATQATIVIPVAGDDVQEPSEEFTLTLSGPPPGATITVATATGTILADEPISDMAPVLANGTQLPAAVPVYFGGPVAGVEKELVMITSENLTIAVGGPNWFIRSGAGNDAIAAHSGRNVLDGNTGSNFLSGGSGADTFFLDARDTSQPIWSTVLGFDPGDGVTIWGVTDVTHTFSWADGGGAEGYEGLTLHATSAGNPAASLTLPGYTTADLAAGGRLAVFANNFEPISGSSYTYIAGL